MARFLWSWFKRSPQQRSSTLQREGNRLVVELLEARDLPSGFQPSYVLLPQSGGATPFSSTGPTGLTPTQIRQAYGFNQITFADGTVAGDGSGTTIAIVDAYNDPDIANDLHQFDLRFGLPDPVFTKVNQSGGSTMPASNGGWSSEIALDVEWSHAIAPKANILLVEANDSSYTNLFAAVTYAAKQSGVVAVSMSWGGGETSTEASSDKVFQTPAGHVGVTFVVSSGDTGAPASYPAASPNVLTVGGTTLNVNSAGNILSETAWSGSGGGASSYEAKPSYQNGIDTVSGTKRGTPDVSYDANPSTGFPVYDSYNNGTSAPWSQFGGTSDAAPQWAALIAIADQGRMLDGLGSLDGRTQTLPDIYALPASDFHDITSGTSTGSPRISAATGYDLVSGRGSPYANKVVDDLVGQTSSTPITTQLSVTASTSTVAGTALTVTVTALDSSGNLVSGYLGTVSLSSSDLAAVLPANYTFTTADHGKHSFSVTLKTAGSQSLIATDTVNSAIVGTLSETVTPAAAKTLAFVQQPVSAIAGVVISPAVTVDVLDAYGNVVSSDNSDRITLAIGTNPASGVLSGTTIVTVSGGIASFSNLSINNAGVGYTLSAKSGSLTTAVSSSFNITASGSGGGGTGGGGTGGSGGGGTVIENFETTETWSIASGSTATAVRRTSAAHDGTYGLDQSNGNDWIYRTNAVDQLQAGDTASVWLKFSGSADGRAYFGFGASSIGTLSLVAAPNTNQLIIQSNLGFGFTDIAAVSQKFQPNQWYRLEVDWGKSGAIAGKLFDSTGMTLLNQVSATSTAITSGGIAFRATGSDKYWDTVTASYGVNTFVSPNWSYSSGPTTSLSSLLQMLEEIPSHWPNIWGELF